MANHSIWVLEFAFAPQAPKGNFLYGAYNEGSIPLSYAYVLIKGGDFLAMVDVGYDHVRYGEILAHKSGIKTWRPPADVLARCGFSPQDVTHVFITHAHYDHMGGIGFFPNATFFIQERELSKWIWAMSLARRFRWFMAATDPADILHAVDLGRQGRLRCVNGVMEDVLPGVDLYPAYDTHTPGSQYVLVRNDGKRATNDGWVLAGDIIYQIENLTGGDERDPYYIPAGYAHGSQTNLLLTTEEMMTHVQHEAKRIVPVHEARLKTLYPSRSFDDGLAIIEIALADRDASRLA